MTRRYIGQRLIETARGVHLTMAMNALTLVIEQHREIEALGRALLVAEPYRRAHVLLQLADGLEAHFENDEKILYPTIRSHRSASVIDRYLDDHHDLRMIVVRLTSQGFVRDPLFIDQVALLLSMFREHAHDEEEAHLLPLLAMSLSEGELEALGRSMLDRHRRGSHPRPLLDAT